MKKQFDIFSLDAAQAQFCDVLAVTTQPAEHNHLVGSKKPCGRDIRKAGRRKDLGVKNRRRAEEK